MSGIDGMLGWSWIFVRFADKSDGCKLIQYLKLIEGMATVVVGIISFFSEARCALKCGLTDLGTVLVDFPDTAHFLTAEERAYLVWKKSRSLVASSTKEFMASQSTTTRQLGRKSTSNSGIYTSSSLTGRYGSQGFVVARSD